MELGRDPEAEPGAEGRLLRRPGRAVQRAEVKGTEDRFTPEALRRLRGAIREAFGNEVLVAGRLDGQRRVTELAVGARGTASAVPALRPYMESGDVVIHNHPSGVLQPSAADFQVASRLGAEGIGFYIVDNAVEHLYVVAEPVTVRELRELDGAVLAGHLAPGGALNGFYPGYEPREAQVRMLEFVCQAFNRSELCIAEAGTGVGKSLAYLIPAVQWVLDNEERVVISTATINLQQQLLEKDIPLVIRMLGRDPGCTLVKGRGNYLCLSRLQEELEEATLFEEEDEALEAIRSWAAGTPTGSRTELPFYPGDELWSRVCSEADGCRGLRCSNREGCFVLKARREAAACRILVANHHLLFSDLALRLSGMGFDSAAVLPPFQRIIFDEAHNVEKNATSYFSESFTRSQVTKYAGRLFRNRKGRAGGLLPALEKSFGAQLRGSGAELREQLAALADKAAILDSGALQLFDSQGALRLKSPHPDPRLSAALLEPMADLAAAIATLQLHFDRILAGCPEDREDSYLVFECRLQLRRLGAVAEICRRFLRYRENAQEIYWLESRKNFRGEPYVRFVITPLDVSSVMKEAVYEPYRTVVFTSATLTVNRQFDYWKNRLGFAAASHRATAEAVFPSPFDYENRVFLGIPGEAPSPEEEGFAGFLADFVLQALLVSEGRGLVLFTSYALLETVFSAIRAELGEAGIPLMRQGEEERHRLLNRFRENTASVLFATDSFWEGIDAPGKALELVILTRLPFRVPTDPVMEARTEALQRTGVNAFWEMALPDAIIRLRQGFGRLMRRRDDYGAVLILDPRIVRKAYGRFFLDSLPRTRRTVSSVQGVLEAFEDFIVS
ncbi:MAG: DEAD/DEAH box helicase, partial [Spirochaetales bacterium]|nr:DEAD/DEAH box helicase [Spirochaetales bacterium]